MPKVEPYNSFRQSLLVYLPLVPLAALLLCAQSLPADDASAITLFSPSKQETGIPAAWQPLTFPKIPTPTTYRTIERNGHTVIQASSRGGASGLVHALDIDPVRFSWLTWLWRVDHALAGADVTKKSADDCAARIYVTFAFDKSNKSWWERIKYKTAKVFSGHELPGSALIYGWTSKAEVGSIIDSPYTDHSKLIAVQSGNEAKGRWIREERNIVEDYQAAFGSRPPRVTGVAIMTDTDNTGASVTAYYGEIRLETNASQTGR